ncbi:tryptophan-rich sensory protein [Actinomadura sp. 21ATH]|uniref:tryptophan-rich sensory protein n=1 Tax=Actinomadura sp. 21ATH TaxID=1735444 RepID=UPI0035BEF6F1
MAWKLDLVLARRAVPELLDSYTVERSAHVQQAIRTSVELGKVICVLDRAAAAERDQAMGAAAGGTVVDTVPDAALTAGVLRRGPGGTPVPAAGELSPQGHVTWNGAAGPFDQVVGTGFVIAALFDPAEALTEDHLAFGAAIGARLVRLAAPGEPVPGAVTDSDGVYHALLNGTGRTAVIIRPDFDTDRAFTEDTEHIRVLLCGTGSPETSAARAQACTLVAAGGRMFLFDAGEGTTRSLAESKVPVARLERVFLTHFHSDHFNGLATLVNATWIWGRTTPLPVWGPAGLDKVVGGLNSAYALDHEYRKANMRGLEATGAAADAVPTEIEFPGGARSARVYDEGGVTIDARLVAHDPVAPAVGYVLTYQGKKVFISGDTEVSSVDLPAMQDADLVVHEAYATHLVRRAIPHMRDLGRTHDAEVAERTIRYHADTVGCRACLSGQASAMRATLLRTGLAVTATAVVGALAVDTDSDWYRGLRKPSWQPPPASFGLVWTPLYALVAYAGARALTRCDDDQRAAMRRALAGDLVLNAAWPVLFFRGHSPRLALADILALNTANALVIRRALAADRRAALLLAPYAGWTVFATALTASIARHDRDA